jgi:hypothetical protein
MSSLLARGTAVAIAVMAGVGIAGAGPASADVRDNDSVYIAGFGSQADFGSGGHAGGQPLGAGNLAWDVQEERTAARLTGRVYWDDLFSGGCARVRVRLYNTSGVRVDTQYSGKACRSGSGSVVSKPVDLTLSTAHAHKVVVTTQKAASATSPFSNVDSQTWYFGQVNGVD